MIKQEVAAFQKWVAAAGSAVVDPGSPVHMVDQVSSGSPAPAADVGGYSMIEAADVNAAKEILKSHPYVGRGGTLQINEVIAIPGA